MTGRKIGVAAGVAMTAFVALVMGQGCPGGGGNGGSSTVSMRNIAFDPDEITIEVGQTVRWENDELLLVMHTVTSGDPGDVDAGDLFEGQGAFV